MDVTTYKKNTGYSNAKDQVRSLMTSDLYLHLLVFIMVFSFFCFLQFSTNKIADRDGYFHIKFSQLMREHGIIYKLPWMQFAIFKDYFRDHHFLQHILYMPFTFGNLIFWGKCAAFIFAALAGLSFYIILRLCRIKYSFFWVVAFLSSSHAFLYRISMLRVQGISLALMLLCVYFIIKKRYKNLAALAFSFVWLYDGFPLLIAITLIFFLCELFIEKKADFKLLIYLFSGMLAGIIINPFFPSNIESYFFNFGRISSSDTSIQVGNEWYPYNTFFLLKDSAFVFILFFGTIGLVLGSLNKKNYILTSTFFVSLLFMVLLFKSRRFIEYWPPFALLFCAFGVNDLFYNNKENRFVKRGISYCVLSIVVLITGYFTITNFVAARKELEGEPSKDYYKGAALWLKEHTKPGTIVFNTDWDDFPQLFFYNTDNYYIVGLDPNYMYRHNKSLYRTWQDITKGKIENPHKIIVEKFNSFCVLTDNEHKGFIKNANKDPNMRIVYKDKYCSVYSIIL
ncbi:MAG: hypothetical protein A2Y09_00170 [Planctomycetes bacterium GWA2_39_15]|nr:MAG: hypothetical protein A2Y09_00170 [Planctomycetes bacterium GWA2_39_15]